jgi:enoyl-CoA hydratase/carnithine racemase
VADIGTLQRLPGLIGQQKCRELAYTGKTFTGQEAEKMGLVLKSFDTDEELDKYVYETAVSIAKKSPITIRGVKKTIAYARDHDVKDSLDQVNLWNTAYLRNNDLDEAFRAVMTKSTPSFKDD